MRHKSILLAASLIVCLIAPGCGSMSVRQEYQKFKTIYVGWLDLGEDNFAKYGYPTKESWIREMKVQNIEALQKYTGDYMKGWKISGATGKQDKQPKDAETLIVIFKNTVFNDQFFSIRTAMEIYDGGTGVMLKQVMIEPSSVSYSPFGGFSNMSFSGRLNNAMYNIAYDIKYHLQNN